MSVFLTASSAAGGVYYAYEYSDGVGKAIVIALVLGSIFTWTIMLDKGFAVFKAKKLCDRFLERFRENCSSRKSICSPALVRDGREEEGPIADMYNEGVEKLVEFYRDAAPEGTHSVKTTKLSDAQLNAIEAVLEREVSHQIQQLETRVNLLATLVSVSPFLGLFGTVWGVMIAFTALAAAGRADIQALAPGISGAMLTTVAGLIVAIPSLVGYNLLTSTIRKVTIYMDNFTEEFIVQVNLEQLEAKADAERKE